MHSHQGVCDGAAAVILASEEAVQKHKLTPLARIVAHHVCGCDPSIMGIGESYCIVTMVTNFEEVLSQVGKWTGNTICDGILHR